VGGCGLDSFGSGWGPVVCPFGNGGGPSGSVEGMKFLDSLGDYYFLEKNSAQCNLLVGWLVGWLVDVILYGIPYRHWISLYVCM
jgi:hypothetical protein